MVNLIDRAGSVTTAFSSLVAGEHLYCWSRIVAAESRVCHFYKRAQRIVPARTSSELVRIGEAVPDR